MNISEHVTYAEAIKSETALKRRIDNTPTAEHLQNMKAIAKAVFEPLRKGLGGKPIRISSFYRSPKLNAGIKGASNTSQHCKGEAMDLVALHCTNAEIFHYIKDNLPFDQLIWEHGTAKNPKWVHVSYTLSRNPRKQVLLAVAANENETLYTLW